MDVIIKCGGYDYAEVLAAHARRLNVRRLPWPLPPCYDIMSDALVWFDEAYLPWMPVELVWALRPLWHYRTGLIIGEPRPYREWWDLGRRLFPLWRGFRPGRCQRSLWLAKLYRGGRAEGDRSLDELEAWLSAEVERGRVIVEQVGGDPCGASP